MMKPLRRTTALVQILRRVLRSILVQSDFLYDDFWPRYGENPPWGRTPYSSDSSIFGGRPVLCIFLWRWAQKTSVSFLGVQVFLGSSLALTSAVALAVALANASAIPYVAKGMAKAMVEAMDKVTAKATTRLRQRPRQWKSQWLR
jgi:hypothetical protein